MIGNRKMTKWFLVMLLVAVVFPANVFAASGDVTSIEFENPAAVHLYVAETTQQLKVLAKIEGLTDKKDVTSDSTWVSSDPSVIKVEKGLLTPLKSGKVTITAKYKGFNLTLSADSAYLFKELKLDQSGTVQYKLGDENLSVKALAVDNDGSTNDVSANADWTSSSTSVVTVAGGKLTLVGKGSSTITAKYKGLTASYKVNVVSPYSELKLVPEQSLPDGDIEMLVGDKELQLNAVAQLSEGGTKQTVSDQADWKSSAPSVVSVDKGKIKALATGKATITASYRGVTAEVTVLVRTEFEALIVNPSNDQTLFLSDSPVQVEASVRNNVDTPREIVTDKAEWVSSNALAVTVKNGLITPRQVGTSTVKVTYKGLSREIKVTVFPTITKIVTEKTSLDMFKGESIPVPKVTATTLDEKKQDFTSNVEWTSSDSNTIVVENGKFVSKGTGKVTLTGKLGQAAPLVVEVVVQEKVLVLLPEKENFSVVIGKELPLTKVTAVRVNGDEEDVTDKIEWSLTGANAVIKGGKIKGLVKGNATLKGTYLNQSLKLPVAVEPQITKIVVEPQSLELNLKRSKSIKVTGFYTNGTKINLSSKMDWVSSNPEVATVSGATVKSLAEGTATLNGSYQGIAAKVDIRVVPKLMKLTVDEKRYVLAPGAVKTVDLVAEYDTGKTTSVTGSAVWTSSKPSVAKVSAGRIEAVAKGTATIKAKYDNKIVTISISVK
ncbi:Ig-like domain-containing protein [Paenibacillus tuaregi]|uniref:Ig-like domain-containing protein n=1 Tax=Paenibacillus tuaregi TaxID=1816681 RepID=UPI0008395941|nr:Ig-like domain-containing protein [Paenibacillus tuaregi]